MAGISRFSAPRSTQLPSSKRDKGHVVQDLRGLDLVNPYDLIKSGRSPDADNFRLYAENEDSRRVVVSTRKGAGYYSDTVGEVQDISNTTTSTGELTVGVDINWQGQSFVPTISGRLSRLDIKIRSTDGVAPIVVTIHENDGGVPGLQLAESGLLASDITDTAAYVTAYFVEAPLLTLSTTYIYVIHNQDNGVEDGYAVSYSAGSGAISSSSGIAGFVSAGVQHNFKAYITPDLSGLGIGRFTPANGQNVTLIPFGTTMYTVDEVTGDLSPLITGLSASASRYNFFFIDGKIGWVNSYDNIRTWDGTLTAANTNLVSNGTFEVNTTGWTLTAGTTLTRSTAQFHSGVASMNMTRAGSGTVGATQAVTHVVGTQYTASMYVKGTAANQATISVFGSTGTVTLTGGWDLVSVTYTATSTSGTLTVSGLTTTSVFIDDITLRSTGVESIINVNLPILRDAVVHKDRLYGLPADELNKFVYSEDPGNADGTGALWYKGYLSTSFVYVPAPKANDPITCMTSFQDSLTIFTTTGKYVLYGTDPGTFYIRQATGKKGCVSRRGMLTDENFIWFVANDGFYKYNGSSDELVSDLVQSEFDSIVQIREVCVVRWRRGIRFYYATTGQTRNSKCLIYHTVFEEWQRDTDVFVKFALALEDGNDDGNLLEVSSMTQTIHRAEQNEHDLGRPISFKYYCKYDSMGMPAQRKRILKFFPLLKGVGSNYPVEVSMDKDLADSPEYHEILVRASGAVWGGFTWGDGTLWGGTEQFKPIKMRYPGYGYYWQLRLRRKGIDTPVAYLGHQYSFREKRL